MVTISKTYCLCSKGASAVLYCWDTPPYTLSCVDHFLNSQLFSQHCLALKHTWSICTSHTLLQQHGVYSDAYKLIKVTDSLCRYLVYSHERQRYIICIPLCTERPIQLSSLETTHLTALNRFHFSNIWRNSK